MNFLAHIYLSGDDTSLQIGNFIADAVKGKKYTEYPITIQHGILLHRKIDTYTDRHPIVKKSTARLFPKYSHYSTVIVDILYDHFLAANWNDFSTIALETYVADFYKLLQSHYELLPQKIQNFLPHMIQQNWLANYATIPGIGNILYQMNRRTNNISKMDLAIVELENYYTEFEQEFRSFFKEIITYTQKEILLL